MKRNILMLLAITLVVGLFLIGGCTGDTSAPAESGEGEGEGEEVTEEVEGPTAEEPITLIFATWEQPSTYMGKVYQAMADMIEENSEGRVIMDMYFSGSLLEYADVFAGCASGRADIVSCVSTMIPADLNLVFNQTYIGIPDQIPTTRAYKDLLANHPELQDEMEEYNTRWLSIRAMPPNQLHLTNKPVRVPNDLKGLKIIAAGDNVVDLVDGAAAIESAPADMYMNLERGLADGQIIHWNAIVTFGLKELYNYHVSFGGEALDTGINAAAIAFVINKDTWYSLPTDIQDIIIEACEWADVENGKHAEGIEAREWSIEQGHTFIELTEEELDEWRKLGDILVEDWIEETEAKGYPASEIYNAMVEYIEMHRE